MQNKAKAPHGEAEECFFFEVQAFDPGESDGDQVDLNVNRAEILEKKRDRIDQGGGLEQLAR